MASQGQAAQVGKLFRAIACSGVILGPYIYTMARPEETLKYRFLRSTNKNGEFVKVDSSYNLCATETAYRMGLPEQLRRTPTFDIRLSVHTGMDFDINGHFTPLFKGMVYLMVPQWANISSVDDLKNVKINIAGQEIDFSNLDMSRISTNKLQLQLNKNERSTVEPEKTISKADESTFWFFRWFTSTSPTPHASTTSLSVLSSSSSSSKPIEPVTREMLLVQKLIETFSLSNEAKKYIIADQYETALGPWHMMAWCCVGGSFFLPFTLYTRLRLQFKTRFKRFLFFHFLLFNGLLFFYLSPFVGRLINMQVSRIRDSTTTSYGLDILEGGIEYLEKQLERNRILRELLPNGKDLFDQDGERRKTRVTIPYSGGLSFSLYHWSPLIAYRLKRLRAKMDILMNAPEVEARAIIGICAYCCIRTRNRELCYNLDQPRDSEYHLTWIICFLPLIILSIMSVFTYVWLLRHGRSWEIQALFVVNILQFIFFALKLDNSIITWHYATVFIPLWTVMGISIIFCIGRLIWTLVHYRRNDIHQNTNGQQRIIRRYCQILASPTVGHIYVLLFLLIFQTLLVFYLEHTFDLSFVIVCLPLYIALVILIYMSFGSRVPPNHWWFGLRQDTCEWLLHLCPIFETYANVEYNFTSNFTTVSLYNVDSTRIHSTVISNVQSNQDIEQSRHYQRHSRRFFFRKNSSSCCDQTKNDHVEGELLTTVILPTSNILKLHEPD
ncbi:unnamed protein product [Rotaria magnacalcarata]